MPLIQFQKKNLKNHSFCVEREFLETNSLGTYSSSTINGCNTRKYHGLLVPKQGNLGTDNYVLLSTLHEKANIYGQELELSTSEFPGAIHPKGYLNLESFELEKIPTWIFKKGKIRIKKELLLHPEKDQLIIAYTNLSSEEGELYITPLFANRRIHDLNVMNDSDLLQVKDLQEGISIRYKENYSPVFIQGTHLQSVIKDKIWYYNHFYEWEKSRGYDDRENLLNPCQITLSLPPKKTTFLSFSLSEEVIDNIESLFGEIKKSKLEIVDLEAALERAAQQFISVSERGTEICAGYHWFGRWGRDTFIALPGLLIARGQIKSCEQVIHTMLADLHDGLLTNIGVGNKKEYNSIDASLWLFWTLFELSKKSKKSKKSLWKEYGVYMKAILSAYREGTHYNIKMLENGLLTGGAPNVALTWMDAKVHNEAVTPRRGCPVEINALWHHAICLSLEWAEEAKDKEFIRDWKSLPTVIKKSFNEIFWSDEKGYLADVVNENEIDWSIRPNQVFAVSLPYRLLPEAKAKKVLKIVRKHLFTPYGMRTLSPTDQAYIGIYQGNQEQRDNSYHQGIIWPWLLGAYMESNFQLFKADFVKDLRKIKATFALELSKDGLASISELYHENPNFKGVGTISQAWSISELIRICRIYEEYKATLK